MLKQFWSEESGQTLVEYGMLISLLAIAAMFYFGRVMLAVWGRDAARYPNPPPTT